MSISPSPPSFKSSGPFDICVSVDHVLGRHLVIFIPRAFDYIIVYILFTFDLMCVY